MKRLLEEKFTLMFFGKDGMFYNKTWAVVENKNETDKMPTIAAIKTQIMFDVTFGNLIGIASPKGILESGGFVVVISTESEARSFIFQKKDL